MSAQTITVDTQAVNDAGRTLALDYAPVPESWLDAPTAVDEADEDSEATRLFAVSAATYGRWILTRYVHPRGGVAVRATGAVKTDDGTAYPKALEPGGRANWPRSIVPLASDGPDDVFRGPELDWLDELWSERADLREVATV